MAAAIANHHQLSLSTLTKATSKIVLQRYQLGSLLGKGSFAKVFLARSLTNNNKNKKSVVAIKVYDKSNIHPQMALRIMNEVAAMRRCKNHPNILKIHEVLASKSSIYLVMELARGGDLSGKLARRPDRSTVPEPLAKRYFRQLVSAVHYCHQQGVTHGNITLQNILLDEENNLKIGGFGLCAVATKVASNNNNNKMMLQTLCGTLPFAAPEMMISYEYDGAKADAWSCGVVLFVMLTGYLPFDDADFSMMLRNMNTIECIFPSWVTKPARGLITRLLDPNPDTRLGIDQTLLQDPWFRDFRLDSIPRYVVHVSIVDMEQRTCEKLSFRGTEIVDALMSTTSTSIGSSSSGGDDGSSSSSSSARMNAFEIIMMSSGFDLGRWYGKYGTRGPKRFTASQPKEVVVEKVIEVGENLGYGLEKCRQQGGCCVWLEKGRFVLLVTVSEVVVEMTVVEMKVVDGGGVGWEQEEGYWNELIIGLGDIIVSWHA